MTEYIGRKLVVVSPVFNDWEAFGRLVELIGALDIARAHEIQVIAVDDGSSEQLDHASIKSRKGNLTDVRVVRLACNMGAMRAIAAGLVVASSVPGYEAVIVMDADGEDRPEDIARLISAWIAQPTTIAVAKRMERSEGRVFRLFYVAYKAIFRLLTGQSITFGSFSLLPRSALHSLIHNPAIWNNLPAAIIRSRIPYVEIETKRGQRFAGNSRMNFVSLSVHGVSAISVYTDVVLLRVIIAMGFLATMVFIGLLSVITIKIATNWAIPGWASYLAASLTTILLQTLVFAGFALFQLLSLRNLKSFIPAADVGDLLLDSDPPNKS
jgi:glycosyltransferase involved in cell wall biosynthesis